MKYQKIIARCNPSQHHSELNELLLEVKKIKPKVIVEIGVHLGSSLKVWNSVFKPEIPIGVDSKIEEQAKNVKALLIEGQSQDKAIHQQVVDALGGKQIDFLFIDGSHLYNDVKKDFELYSPLVRKGGVVGFHDVALVGHEASQVNQHWDKLKVSHKTKTISHRHKAGWVATGAGLLYL